MNLHDLSKEGTTMADVVSLESKRQQQAKRFEEVALVIAAKVDPAAGGYFRRCLQQAAMLGMEYATSPEEEGHTVPGDFKNGDCVEHFNRNFGRVVEITKDGTVKVKFDSGKDCWYGEYDDLWFRLHPSGLRKATTR